MQDNLSNAGTDESEGDDWESQEAAEGDPEVAIVTLPDLPSLSAADVLATVGSVLQADDLTRTSSPTSAPSSTPKTSKRVLGKTSKKLCTRDPKATTSSSSVEAATAALLSRDQEDREFMRQVGEH